MNSQLYNQVSINIDSSDSSWFTDYNKSKNNGCFSKCKRVSILVLLKPLHYKIIINLIIFTINH